MSCGVELVTDVHKDIGESNTHLTIIKSAFHSQTMHIRILYCSHLRLLNRTDFALGIHDEDADILLASQAVDGSTAGVSAGSPNHREPFPVLSFLARISPHEEVLEQVAHELQRHILEGERGPVEQLKQMQVPALVQSNERCHVLGSEGGVRTLDDVSEVFLGDLVV